MGKSIGIYKECLICSKPMYVIPCKINTKKYCSNKCRLLNNPMLYSENRKKISDKRRGYKMPLEQKNNYSKIFRGKNNPNYRHGKRMEGIKEFIGYLRLHKWVRTQLGKPRQCQFCKTKDGRLEWANKSWQYKQDINDWIPLCKQCHAGYDSNNKNSIREIRRKQEVLLNES